MKKFLLLALFPLMFTLLVSCEDDDSCIESTFYADTDDDGLGDPNTSRMACERPDGFVENADDTDDTMVFEPPPILWQGANITFTKADNADPNSEAAQDRITDMVWITRGNKGMLYNVRAGDGSVNGCTDGAVVPTDTEWAKGSITDGVENLTFVKFTEYPLQFNENCTFNGIETFGSGVLHLISENIYIDINFLSWTAGRGGGGGGFSYERSTPSEE